MSPPVGVPVKLLHEAIGHTVTVETRVGDLYRGFLMQSEDSMNVLLNDVIKTAKDGAKTSLEQVFIRGSQIRYFIVPDMLKHAPMFKNLLKQRTGGASSGPAKGSAFGTMTAGGKGKGGKGRR